MSNSDHLKHLDKPVAIRVKASITSRLSSGPSLSLPLLSLARSLDAHICYGSDSARVLLVPIPL